MKVLFISNGSALQPILYFQGITHIKELKKKGIDYTLLSFEERENYLDKENIKRMETLEKELSAWNINWIKIPLRIHWLLPKWLEMNLLCFMYTLKLIISKKIKIIHIRSYQVALIGVIFKYIFNISFIFDARGLFPEERVLLRLWGKNGFCYRFSKIFEKIFMLKADSVIVVSRAFKQYIKKLYNSDKITIIANCVGMDAFYFDQKIRKNIRHKLGMDDKFVLIYSGSMQIWHSLSKLVDFFINFKKKVKNAYFLFLSYEHKDEVCEKMLSRGASLSDFLVIDVDPRDVSKYLQVADLAVILMEENIVTKVCCPTKFSQYLACGLPVIVNKNIGDTQEITEKYGAGIIIDLNKGWDSEIEKILDYLNHNGKTSIREKCVEAARKEFCLESAVEKYCNVINFAYKLRRT